MTVIELSDQQAEALKAKAAAQGLTLEAWLKLIVRAMPGRPFYHREGKMAPGSGGAHS